MAHTYSSPLFPSRWGLVGRALGFAAHGLPSAARWTGVWPLRIGLVVGCLLALGIAAWLAVPSDLMQADPALARVLRGMALIKGVVAVGAASAVFWRLSWPISGAVAGVYLVSTWMLAGAAMLIWQLSSIALAALVFHAALVSMLVVGWRER